MKRFFQPPDCHFMQEDGSFSSVLDIETDMVGRVRRLAVGEPFFPAEGGERRASLRVVTGWVVNVDLTKIIYLSLSFVDAKPRGVRPLDVPPSALCRSD